MPSSILHTTDTFLDRKNMSRKQRQEDYLRAFKQAVAHALREDVDGVIHTGNIFWTKNPPVEIVEECKKLLSRLADANIPFWLVYSDRDRRLTVLRELREEGLLRRLSAEWETIGDIAVCGVDSATSLRSLNQTNPAPPEGPRIVCSHEEITVAKLTRVLETDIDAVLLGNQNSPVARVESGCRVLSPGSPERILGKWMTEPETSGWDRPRRVNIYTITKDSVNIESPRIDARDYEGLIVETDETTTIGDVRTRLDQANLADKAVLLILRGAKNQKSPSRKSIQEELNNRCEIARIYDRRDDIDEATESADRTGDSSRQTDETEDQGTRSGQRRSNSKIGISSDSTGNPTENNSKATSRDEIDTATDPVASDEIRKSCYSIEREASPRSSIEFTSDELRKLDTADGERPDSSDIATKFEQLKMQVEVAFANTAWFDSFIWQGDPGSPYIGPSEPEQSQYIWFGLAHETYQTLGKPSGGLQFEFGVDRGTTRGFFNRTVICGLYFGPWASEPVTSDIADRIESHRDDLATFLKNRPGYILETKTEAWDSLSPEDITNQVDALTDGFTLTLDFTLEDLCTEGAIVEEVCHSICELLPLYARLAGVKELAQADEIDLNQDNYTERTQRQAANSCPDTSTPDTNDVEPTVEAIEAYSSLLDTENIRTTIDTLTKRGVSEKEALRYVRQYAGDMERGEGLYAVQGLGPVGGHALSQAGITNLEDLLESSLSDLRAVDGLSNNQARRILENAQDENQAAPVTDPPAESPRDTNSDVTSANTTNKQENQNRTIPQSDVNAGSASQSADNLPVVTYNGQDIQANQLSEYYEAVRCVRKVAETVLQLRGTDIDPEDLTDPRVQYYVLLDACIGQAYPELMFTGYGQQHRDRLPFGIKEYRQVFGDGDWVTEYHGIAVEPYDDKTQSWLAEQTWLEDTQRFVRPCGPDDISPLPEMVESFEDLRGALATLATFPAYPPLPMETGATERTIPVENLYSNLFAELSEEHMVDIEMLSGPGQATGDPIKGPVADATPTSQADAESFLLDYGKLTHLFQRVAPPGQSPMQQTLPVFALDWYRPSSESFNQLQNLAKHGRDEPIATFRPRLQDMVHRRFLRDRWNYDYITVFPGHKAGQLSPQLVELAKDSVVETSVIYAPLLERTETTKRQREKSHEERKEVAINPEETLRVHSTFDGETVILLDDICTSGSSLLGGAHLLRKAGAGRVIGLTLGFTPGGSEANIKEIKKPDTFASDIIAGLE